MTDVPAFVTHDVATTLADLRFRDGVYVKKEVLHAVEQQVTDALVDLMGPRGDTIFLDLYALASGNPFAENGIASLWAKAPSSNKSLTSQAYYDEIEFRRHQMEDRRRNLMRQTAGSVVHVLNLDTRLVLSGFQRPDHGDYDAYTDEFIHALIDYLGPGAEYGELLKVCQRMMVLGPFPCDDYHGVSSLFFTVRPMPQYRTALMGELAEPWENMPPPYDRYVPKKRP